MPILQQRDQEVLRQRFAVELKRDTRITLYTLGDMGGLYIPGRECRSCRPTQELLEELTALSRRLRMETIDFYGNEETARSRGVEKIPAIIIHSDGGDNARFYGMPSGFEFPVLVDTIISASVRRSSLQLETRKKLRRLKKDVRIQVFVTPSCSYSPTVARVAHGMALESPNVVADVVEIQEFPQLAQLHRVMGVPKTIINNSVQFTGAVSEDVFLKRVLEAIGEEKPDPLSVDQITDKTTPIA